MTRERKRRQYGTGSVYRRSSDGLWCGSFDAGFTKSGARRRPIVTGRTEAEAKAKLKAKMKAYAAGGEVGGSRVTLKAWVDEWLPIVEKTDTPNAHTTDLAAARWIVATIGHKRIDELTPKDVRAVRTAITDAGRSTSTALRYHGTLMRLLKAALGEGHPVPARVFNVTPPTKAVSDRTDMTIDEALAMLEQAATLPHGSRWLAALLYAPRQAECLGLTLPFAKAEQLTIAWQLQPLPYRVKRDRTSGFRVPDGYEAQRLDGRMHLVRPKSAAGWRVAPTLPILASALDHWRAIAPASPFPLVWPAEDGRWRDENDDRAEWYAMQDAAGIRHPAGRHYYVHEIRHTTATLLLALGVDEATRIAIMGHSSIASTRAYEHRDLTLIRAGLEKVAGRLQLG